MVWNLQSYEDQEIQMQITTQIESLIQNLRNVQKSLASDNTGAQAEFENILNATLADLKLDTVATAPLMDPPESLENELQTARNNGIPSWVDLDYGFDPSNPRKPNMRELMEALSGRSVEALYADPGSNWQHISRQASEMLYGVVGSNEDTRNWQQIMAAPDILKAARHATGIMYEPIIDIASEYSDEGQLIDQVAILKDKTGSILRALPENIESARETLNDFGATSKSIPDNFGLMADTDFLNNSFVNFLENFRGLYEQEQLAKVNVTSTSEALAT